jgi:hypothetical protein
METAKSSTSNLKRIVIGVIASLVLLGMAAYFLNERYGWLGGTSALPNYDYAPDEFTKLDLALYDKQKRKQLSYGMHKSEAEEIVGAATEEILTTNGKSPIEFLGYEDGLAIGYRLDRAVSFQVTDAGGDDRFVTMRNIGFASGSGDPLVTYGLTPTSSEAGYLTYLFEKTGDDYRKLSEITNDRDRALTTYLVSFKTENNKLVSFSISDMLFATNYQ